MEVLERRQDLDDVRQRLVGRDRVVAARLAHPLFQQGFQRRPADVLHDDVAGVVVRDEVVDLDDVRVRDLGEEPLLGDRRGQGVGVAGVEQTLEDDPAVRHVLVAGEVDPAEAAVGQAAGHLVLAGDEVAGLELGVEGERLAALRAEPGRPAGVAVLAASDRVAAVRAEPLVLRDHRVLHQRLAGVDGRSGRDGRQAGAEPRGAQPLRLRAHPARLGAARDAGSGRPEGDRGESVAGPRHRRRRARDAGGAARGTEGVRVAGGAAGVAVPVEDVALAAGLGARGAVGDG